MDQVITQVRDPLVEFARDSLFLVRKMNKPDSKGTPSLARLLSPPPPPPWGSKDSYSMYFYSSDAPPPPLVLHCPIPCPRLLPFAYSFLSLRLFTSHHWLGVLSSPSSFRSLSLSVLFDRKRAFPSLPLLLLSSPPPLPEFQKIAFATLIGFAVMGFVGMAVKLVFIPVNNFIIGV